MEDLRQIEVHDDKKEIFDELKKITKELETIKEIGILINQQLENQNERLEHISTINENSNQLIINSTNNLESINTEIKKSSAKKYAFISVITGAVLLPISLKIAASVAFSGLLFSKIKN
jgi:hypothetical protein